MLKQINKSFKRDKVSKSNSSLIQDKSDVNFEIITIQNISTQLEEINSKGKI